MVQLVLNHSLSAHSDCNHVLIFSGFFSIFHHSFLGWIEHIGQHVNTTGLYSLEFEYKGSYSVMSIRYWKNSSLVKCQMCLYPSSTDLTTGQLQSIAKVLSAFSAAPQFVCLSGCSLATSRTLETSKLLKKGIEYPFRFNALSLPTLIHSQEGSVFGRIDFYTQLKDFVVFVSGCQNQHRIAIL